MKNIIITIYLIVSRKINQFAQQKYRGNYHTRCTQNITLLVGFFVVIFGLYFISIPSNTTLLPSGND